MRKSHLICGLAVSAAIGSHAFATTLPAPISNLTGGQSFVEGDKTFSNFTYTPAPVGVAPAPVDVSVNSFAPGQYGVSFVSDWEATEPGGPTFEDSSITYEVSVTNPKNFITKVDLDMAAIAVGDSSASVLETVIDLQHNLSYSLAVSTKAGFGAFDQISIAPSNHLKLVKDIIVKAGSHEGTGDAVISTVENGFHQSSVPEPMSLALLPMAMAGLGLRKKMAK